MKNQEEAVENADLKEEVRATDEGVPSFSAAAEELVETYQGYAIVKVQGERGFAVKAGEEVLSSAASRKKAREFIDSLRLYEQEADATEQETEAVQAISPQVVAEMRIENLEKVMALKTKYERIKGRKRQVEQFQTVANENLVCIIRDITQPERVCIQTTNPDAIRHFVGHLEVKAENSLQSVTEEFNAVSI